MQKGYFVSYFYKGKRLTHLNKLEVAIWKRFLDKYEDKYTNYVYDFHLPIAKKPPVDLSPTYVANMNKLSAKRIDVVMEGKFSKWLVEIRPKARQTSIGQLSLYYYLYRKYYASEKRISLMLVSDIFNPEIAMSAKQLNISYIVV